MDIDKLVRNADARLRLDLVAPPRPPASEAPLLAPPGRANPKLATTALGYLLRFELQRRLPEARARPWLADEAPARIDALAPDLAPHVERILRVAKEDHARYVREPAPRPEFQAVMAAHALSLGRLEALVRSDYVDARIAEPEDARDVDDLVAMLSLVPWDTMGGATSADLGHSDVILDGRLLVLHAGRSASVDRDDLRGLVVRLMLARAARDEDASFPDVVHVGVYAARHGILWTTPARPIVDHAAYAQIAAWIDAQLQGSEATRWKPPGWARRRATPGFGSAAARREGKAETKKPPAPAKPSAPAKKSPPAKRATMRDEPDAEPETKRPSKPDWRKGSSWRRERGR